MVNNELLDERQAFLDSIDSLVRSRIDSSRPVMTLSERHGKLLRAMEDTNGGRFVMRQFTPNGAAEMELGGLDFETAYYEMNCIFPSVGIHVLPNYLLLNHDGFPYTLLSPYIEGTPLKDASTETKISVAKSFAKFASPGLDVGPTVTMFHTDMFIVNRDETGEETPYLIDIDPRMSLRFSRSGHQAVFLNRLGELFYDKWCTEEEKTVVIPQLVVALSLENPALGEDFDTSNPEAEAFMTLHMMGNGIDDRARRHSQEF